MNFGNRKISIFVTSIPPGPLNDVQFWEVFCFYTILKLNDCLLQKVKVLRFKIIFPKTLVDKMNKFCKFVNILSTDL